MNDPTTLLAVERCWHMLAWSCWHAEMSCAMTASALKFCRRALQPAAGTLRRVGSRLRERIDKCGLPLPSLSTTNFICAAHYNFLGTKIKSALLQQCQTPNATLENICAKLTSFMSISGCLCESGTFHQRNWPQCGVHLESARHTHEAP